jgi:nucleoside 2-deoxyribosyltransferase
MILRGILDNSLNGQLCLRGFAPIRELARISKADYSYQRDPIERDDILDFLEKETYLFFPEIILSYKIKHSFEKSQDTVSPLSKIQEGKNFKSNIDKTQIKIAIHNKQTSDLTGKSNIIVAELIFDDNELKRLVQINNQPLHRIDGNHRLRAAERLNTEKVNRMSAPFCILLGEEFYVNNNVSDNPATGEFDKSVKVFFHNINTKTIPLKSEENLKVLIDDEQHFADNELEKIFNGIYPLKTRELIKKAAPSFFTNIQHILKDSYRTYYNDIFRRLLDKKKENPDAIVNRVFESLKELDQLYKDERLKENNSIGLLTAFLYYDIEEDKLKFEQLKNWIFNNHIFDIKEITADSIIKIFDKVSGQEIKVFVAMPYYDSKIIEEYNIIYEGVINKIQTKYAINISLFPIMENRGETQDQIQDIINKIKRCDIFIADISDNNANVLYETGWARALNKHVILFREKASKEPKSDYANDTYHEYDNNARYVTLEKIAMENIVEVLHKNFGIIHE